MAADLLDNGHISSKDALKKLFNNKSCKQSKNEQAKL